MDSILIWGTKNKSVKISNTLKNYNSLYFVDNNSSFWGKYVNDILVVKPQDIKDKTNSIQCLIIPNYTVNVVKQIYNQAREQLELNNDQILIISERGLKVQLERYNTLEEILKQKLKKIMYINSIEFEVTHHCNLNCKGCNHFAPLSKPQFGELRQFVSDLTQLKNFVDYIEDIRLLGGEPLLNNELNKFIEEAHRIYPNANIHILTNGILIKRMDEKLMAAIRNCDAVVGITIYPPVRKHIGDIEEFLKIHEIKYDIFGDTDVFSGGINVDGTSNGNEVERQCEASSCHIIEDGKLFKCTVGCKLPTLFNYFEIENDFERIAIDLYEDGLCSDRIFDYLLKANDMCKYCGKLKMFKWQKADKIPALADWKCEG